jgi:Fe-S-cluster containining protein
MTDESNSHRGATNQQQVPWYAEGLSFTCTGCGNCCTGAPGFVWVSEEEIDQLADWLTMDRAQFVRQYVRKVGRRKSLVEYASGDCVFFDPETRRCRVYPVRPGQCRTWPFWDSNLRSPAAWESTCTQCPGAGRGQVVPLEEIERQRRVVSI